MALGDAVAGQLKAPNGRGAKSTTGGADVIKKLLAGLKKMKFTGQVRVELDTGGLLRTGHIVLKGGELAIAIHTIKAGESEEYAKGMEALKRAWEDSYNPNAMIDVRRLERVDDILSDYPGAGIEGKPKREGKVALRWGRGEEKGEIERRIEVYKKDGYDVSALQEALARGDEEGWATMVRFESSIPMVKAVEAQLPSLVGRGVDEDLDLLRAILRDPLRAGEAERMLASIRERLAERAKAGAPIVEMREVVRAHGEIIQELVKCEVCGKMVRQGAPCPLCGNVPEEIIPPPKPSRPGLNPGLTFERFVVGSTNRLAHASAMTVATKYYEEYNPLFIYAGAGLGKTHLLSAIGNEVVLREPARNVVYLSAKEFADQLMDAIRDGKLEELRGRLNSADLLLIDDVHFLAQTEAAQDELFHVFNELRERKRQIVLASDRHPKDITGLAERLISRFESGLVIDIQPPDIETRVAILAQRCGERGLEIEEVVLREIATRVARNVRKLEGALSKLSLYAQISNLPITKELVVEALKDEFTEEDGRRLPAPPQKASLVPSHSYLVVEEKPALCFSLVADLLSKGYTAMIVTRTKPERLLETYDLKGASLLWLTDKESATEETIGPSLEKIVYRFTDVITLQKESVLLLDGIEYLIGNNNFEAVLRFLRHLIDDVAESKCIFLLSVTPSTIAENEQKMIEREMEILTG
ncbi:MAG: DnaA/Hda family protein [Candidatus Thermoplasmatota archaeon]